MIENTFTAYFRRNNHANGETTMSMPSDGKLPEAVMWEGSIYQLWDANIEAGEGYYEYFGEPVDEPKI